MKPRAHCQLRYGHSEGVSRRSQPPRCLDLIDVLTELRADGLNEQLDAIR